MVLLEFLLISLVGGAILGVSWRLIDDWRERAKAEAVQNPASEVTDSSKKG